MNLFKLLVPRDFESVLHALNYEHAFVDLLHWDIKVIFFVWICELLEAFFEVFYAFSYDVIRSFFDLFARVLHLHVVFSLGLVIALTRVHGVSEAAWFEARLFFCKFDLTFLEDRWDLNLRLLFVDIPNVNHIIKPLYILFQELLALIEVDVEDSELVDDLLKMVFKAFLSLLSQTVLVLDIIPIEEGDIVHDHDRDSKPL